MGDKGLESSMLAMMGSRSIMDGDPYRGYQLEVGAEEMALETGDPRHIFITRFILAMAERFIGRPAKAVDLTEGMKELMQEMLNITNLMYLINHRGMALAEIGRIEEAIAILKDGIDLAEKFGVMVRMGALYNTLGYCYSEIHHPDRAWGFNVKSVEISRGLVGQESMGRRQFLEMAAQGSVNMMENLYDQGDLEKAWSGMELLKEESKNNDFDFFRYRWESRMNYLAAEMLLYRNDFDQAEHMIREDLESARGKHLRKREGGFLRLLGEVQMRQGETESAISNLNEAVIILKDVGNPRQLWQAYSSLASAFDKLGRSSEAREQWGAAAEVIRRLANGLSDRELREGFLQAEPIQEILSKTES